MALTRKEREQRRIEEAELLRRHRATLADDVLRQRTEATAEPPPGPCRLHPEWRPRQWELGGGGTCPKCVAAELANREPKREERKVEPFAVDDRQHAAYVDYFERHPSPEGAIEPKSEAEAVALALIDRARDEEAEAERRRGEPSIGARLVSARSEENIWTEYYSVPGHGIVRVTP